MKLSDGELTLLVNELKAGNTEPFTKLYDCCGKLVFKVAYRILNDKATAHDIVQDVFADLWEKRAGTFRQGSFRAYLIRAARNRSIDKIREGKRFNQYTQVQKGILTIVTNEAIVDTKRKRIIRNTIKKLPTEQQKVLELYYLLEYSLKEIASETGKSIQTVKNLLGTAKKALREKLILLQFN